MANDMQTSTGTPSVAMVWIAWILTAAVGAMFGMSAFMKLVGPPSLTEGFEYLGWPVKLAIPLGIVELTCAILYVIPQTAVLGAILLTGYLGGAIATHVRIEEPFLVHLVLGIALWLGIFLRDPRLWKLLPLRR